MAAAYSVVRNMKGDQIMNIEELIKMLDGHMAQGGGSIKPKIEAEEEQERELFSGELNTECINCASIPNLSDVDQKEE